VSGIVWWAELGGAGVVEVVEDLLVLGYAEDFGGRGDVFLSGLLRNTNTYTRNILLGNASRTFSKSIRKMSIKHPLLSYHRGR